MTRSPLRVLYLGWEPITTLCCPAAAFYNGYNCAITHFYVTISAIVQPQLTTTTLEQYEGQPLENEQIRLGCSLSHEAIIRVTLNGVIPYVLLKDFIVHLRLLSCDLQ